MSAEVATTPAAEHVDASSSSSADATVDTSAPHPLSSKWSFRFSPSGGFMLKGKWESDMHDVASVDTVEDFWRLYNSIKPPSRLAVKNTYSFFKGGVMPEFEDPANVGGFKISVGLPLRTPIMDDVFMHTLLLLVGQQFPDPHLPTGLYLSVRKGEVRIAVWLRRAGDAALRAASTFYQDMLDREFKASKLSVETSSHDK